MTVRKYSGFLQRAKSIVHKFKKNTTYAKYVFFLQNLEPNQLHTNLKIYNISKIYFPSKFGANFINQSYTDFEKNNKQILFPSPQFFSRTNHSRILMFLQ